MIAGVKKCERWIALGGIASVAYWFWRRSGSSYRHRFTDLTDALVSPYNLGFCLYNWGFNVLGGRRHDAFRRHVINLAELRGDEDVLDAGCGTGLTALRIADQHPGCRVYGIDLSPKMIDVARNDAAERGLDVDLRVGSITDLPYPDESFDVVLTNIMFHHLDLAEKRQAVAEVVRVLRSPEPAEGRPGGRYVSAEFGPRARNPVERRLAKGEYTLYPSHLAEAGLSLRHEELRPFVWGLQVYYRVAVKPEEVAPDTLEEENVTKILVYGAGPLGSLFAARLKQGGNDVSILARGQRLAELREHGIVLVDAQIGEQSVTRVNVVERLAPDDAYDLVLVIMRKNHALQILPVLAANQHTPNVLFLMNNAAGPGALVEALGQERVLIGFSNSAGYREGHVVHCLTGTEDDKAYVPFGEVDGRITARTLEVARILETAPGFGAQLRTDMDAWLKYHVALLFPSLAPALHASGVDNYRLARTRDLVVLAIRAMREAFRVLRSLGLPVTPSKFRLIEWLPEPILVLVVQRLLANPLMETALVKHAQAARSEVDHLIDEFMALARSTSVATPTIDCLLQYYEPDASQVPDGSAEIPLRWGGMVVALGALAMLVIGGVLLAKRLFGAKR